MSTTDYKFSDIYESYTSGPCVTVKDGEGHRVGEVYIEGDIVTAVLTRFGERAGADAAHMEETVLKMIGSDDK